MIEVIKLEEGELIIKGDATVAYADNLHKGLSDAFGGDSGQASINLEGLNDLDTAGAQVLISFRKSHGAKKVNYERCPDSMRLKLEKSGLDVHLF